MTPLNTELYKLPTTHYSEDSRVSKGPISGLNVVGFLSDESGLGSAVRNYVHAFKSLELPLAYMDLSELTYNRSNDRSILPDRHKVTSWHNTNLICVNANDHFRVMAHAAHQGSCPTFEKSYNIGVWFWELPDFPDKWQECFLHYDEIWASTSFIAKALSPVSPVPVICVPPVLDVMTTGSRARGRHRLGLSADEYTFLFVFDFHSYFKRKNPLALIEAFKQAFAPADAARLILKCVNENFSPDEFAQLQGAVQGYPISLQVGYWDKQEMQDLFEACDAYVSLHRSEGIGLTMAEAMAIGKPVIATGWSGNTDYMRTGNSFLVPYNLVPVTEKVGPYKAGSLWADPSIEHAATMMRHIFDNRETAQQIGQVAQHDIKSQFSDRVVTRVIEKRLGVIERRAQYATLKKSWQLGEIAPKHVLYQRLTQRIEHVVNDFLPDDAFTLVVSRGDEALLRLGGRTAWHFPCSAHGTYSGAYPADSTVAIAHLEELRDKGADYLIFPFTAFWWLDYYAELTQHLEQHYEVLVEEPETCVIFSLARPSLSDAASAAPAIVADEAQQEGGPIVEPDVETSLHTVIARLPDELTKSKEIFSYYSAQLNYADLARWITKAPLDSRPANVFRWPLYDGERPISTSLSMAEATAEAGVLAADTSACADDAALKPDHEPVQLRVEVTEESMRLRDLSAILWNIYAMRPDVQAAFPDVCGADHEGFLAWVRTHGVQELGYNLELIERSLRGELEPQEVNTASELAVDSTQAPTISEPRPAVADLSVEATESTEREQPTPWPVDAAIQSLEASPGPVPLVCLPAHYSAFPPTEWVANEYQVYTVTVTNSGDELWKAAGSTPVCLGVHFGSQSDELHDGWVLDERFTLYSDLAPGASQTLTIRISAPEADGRYVLRHRMLMEGVCWSDEILKTEVVVAASQGKKSRQRELAAVLWDIYDARPDVAAVFPDVCGADYEAFVGWVRAHGAQEMGYDLTMLEQCLNQPIDSRMRAQPQFAPTFSAVYSSDPPLEWMVHENRSYVLTLTNSGNITWPADGPTPVRLSVHFATESDVPHEDWACEQRFNLPRDLTPGASVEFSLFITAPSVAGSYVLRHRVLQEGIVWVDQIEKFNVRVKGDLELDEIESVADLPFGLNLVGYISSEKGLGEAARTTIHSVRAANIPHVLNNFIDPGSSNMDTTFTDFAETNTHSINVIQVNPAELPGFFASRDRAYLHNRYNIGYWWWELSTFPREWQWCFNYFNEIWVGSDFALNTISRVSPVPVVKVPPAISTDFVTGDLSRAALGLPEDAFVFLFVFDFHSSIERKNPFGVLRAFKKAFSKDDNAILVLKCSRPQHNPLKYQLLLEEARGANVRIIDTVLSRPNINALFSLADCYTSLHRAEGYGLPLAEAMSLGKPVIATGYSGNTDFMSLSNSFLVKYELTEIQTEDGFYKKGYVWADPDINHAAEHMRYVYDHRDIAQAFGRRAQQDIKQYSSFQAIGSIIKERLVKIAQFQGALTQKSRQKESLDIELPTGGKFHSEKQIKYQQLVGRVRELVESTLPIGAKVLVVSKGDEQLVTLGKQQGQHFPQDEDGTYPGYYPVDSATAIKHLEDLRNKGAEYLVFPETAFWWLDHYLNLKHHLSQHYELVVNNPDTCLVYALRHVELPTRGAHEGLPEPAFELPEREVASPDMADLSAPASLLAHRPRQSETSLEHTYPPTIEAVGPAGSTMRTANPRCSIIIPVYNKAFLTEQCINTILTGQPQNVSFEIIVSDDASTDTTQEMLVGYGDRVKSVRHTSNKGFAATCNDGAGIAQGEYLIFLNNDTIPLDNWLETMVLYAESHPEVGIVGSKLLFPDNTVQHAGIVICQDRHPRHIYAGFPSSHPIINRSRRYTAVTGACLLIKKTLFDALGGFDTTFVNSYEDVDLCLRAQDLGYETHYCHESVLYHLESVTREGRKSEDQRNAEVYYKRWADQVRPDDVEYYIRDGFLKVEYKVPYPVVFRISPLLGLVSTEARNQEIERLLETRTQHVVDLLKENIRVGVLLQESKSQTRDTQNNVQASPG